MSNLWRRLMRINRTSRKVTRVVKSKFRRDSSSKSNRRSFQTLKFSFQEWSSFTWRTNSFLKFQRVKPRWDKRLIFTTISLFPIFLRILILEKNTPKKRLWRVTLWDLFFNILIIQWIPIGIIRLIGIALGLAIR